MRGTLQLPLWPRKLSGVELKNSFYFLSTFVHSCIRALVHSYVLIFISIIHVTIKRKTQNLWFFLSGSDTCEKHELPGFLTTGIMSCKRIFTCARILFIVLVLLFASSVASVFIVEHFVPTFRPWVNVEKLIFPDYNCENASSSM